MIVILIKASTIVHALTLYYYSYDGYIISITHITSLCKIKLQCLANLQNKLRIIDSRLVGHVN